jgi:sugar/nucleoside kinase (ribokinase family)
MRTDLYVIGNISRDRVAYPDGREFAFWGGAALNIGVSAARAGCRVVPISLLGDDAELFRTHHDDSRFAGLDFGRLGYWPGSSCSFKITYGWNGDVLGVACSFGVCARLTAYAVGAIQGRGHYHVCCRRPLDPDPVLARISHLGMPYSLDFYSASIADLLPRAVPFVGNAQIVFVNATEAAFLAHTADIALLRRVVISDGAAPARVLRHGQTTAIAKPPHVPAVDVTAAGDTLAGVFLACNLAGRSDDEGLTEAVIAAADSVRRPGVLPVEPDQAG